MPVCSGELEQACVGALGMATCLWNEEGGAQGRGGEEALGTSCWSATGIPRPARPCWT